MRRMRTRTGLVDEVDRLVGEVAVGDGRIARWPRHDRPFVIVDPWLSLVTVAQPSVFDRGATVLRDLDGAGTAARVAAPRLEVLAVLVERLRTDRLQLTAGEPSASGSTRVDRTRPPPAPTRVCMLSMRGDVAARADLLHTFFIRHRQQFIRPIFTKAFSVGFLRLLAFDMFQTGLRDSRRIIRLQFLIWTPSAHSIQPSSTITEARVSRLRGAPNRGSAA